MILKSLVSYIALLLFFPATLFSQDSLVLSIVPFNSFLVDSKFINENAIQVFLNEERHSKLNQGYLEFSIDSLIQKNDTVFAHIYNGKKYSFGSIKISSELIGASKERRLNRFEGGKLNSESIKSVFDLSLSKYEDNGYPFASISLEQVELQDSILSAIISVEHNKYVVWDSVIVKTEGKASSKYLSRYLGIIPGRPYDESAYRVVGKKLNELSFLSSMKKPEVLFTESGAQIYLYVKEKQANSFNGIIGFQPNEQNGKINITGDLEIQLVNKLNQGERLKLSWKRLESLSQNLDVQFTYPYVFNTDLGIDAGINLFRRDTTFSQVQSNAGLHYKTGASSYVKVFVENNKSTRLSTFSEDLVLADISTLYYGMGVFKEKLDYKFNPRKGYSVVVTFGVGNRKVSGVDEELGNEKSSNIQYKGDVEIDLFFPILPRSTLFFGAKGFWLSGNDHFENEMFRFGGVKTLRGFDEASFHASSIAIGTIEFRYLLDQNSNLHLFFDQGWYESQTAENFIMDTPFGFGAGASFQTNAGIFSFSYGLGSQFSNPILFKNGKIHFGFTNFF